MALVVWFTMGIALWHFTVFLPDRFWQGIVGAFIGAVAGAVLFGLSRSPSPARASATPTSAPRCWRSPASRSASPSSGVIGVRAERQAGLVERGVPLRALSGCAGSAALEKGHPPLTQAAVWGCWARIRPVPASLVVWPRRSRHTAPTPTPTRGAGARRAARAERAGRDHPRPPRLPDPRAGARLPRGRRVPRPGRVRLDGDGRRPPRARRSRPASGSRSTATSTSTGSARPRSWSAPCASWGPTATG